MEFSRQSRVREIAVSNTAARQALEENGIDYCCGGAKTLQEACFRAGVSPEDVLQRLRGNSVRTESEKDEWSSAALASLTSYIRTRHHGYVRGAIPTIQALLAKVNAKHGAGHAELQEIAQCFAEVAHEMHMHMQKEEQILFPYIETLERAAKTHEPVEAPFFQTVRNPIQAMMNEHDAAGDLLKRIRKASNQYQIPPDACQSYKAAYGELREFESDLHQHVHLENNILFPRAVELEAALL